MVELRKRPAPPPAPPPAKKKAAAKPKAKKETPATTDAKMEDAPAKTGAPAVGDSIELDSFGGEVETNDETKVTLAKLVEDSKSGVVLFTYPKASTPGCKYNSMIKQSSWY
jgi:thioredoxin-dependent peroxiredoxin